MEYKNILLISGHNSKAKGAKNKEPFFIDNDSDFEKAQARRNELVKLFAEFFKEIR